MTLQEANKILDHAKEGQPIPQEVVDEALFMTGDAAGWIDFPCPQIEQFVESLRKGGFL